MALQAFSLPLTFLARSVLQFNQNQILKSSCQPALLSYAWALCKDNCIQSFPPSSAYIVLLQFNEWSSKLHAAAYYCGLSVLRMDTTIAHQAWNHSLTGLARKTVSTSLYGRTSCLLDLKKAMLTDQSLYKRIVKALWNATQMCSMLSMWLAHIKAKINLNMHYSFSEKLAGER